MNDRKLIRKNETKISWLQIVGFVLIILSLLYFIGKFIYNLTQWSKDVPAINFTAEEVSILFFIIMLGFAFAFPDLLQDENKGLSTMRIVVFMMLNVISMLLLKIGWNAADFKSIGIDGYWMGIVAFIFGAKAVQSLFERLATLRGGRIINNLLPQQPITLAAAQIISGKESAQLAINQNKNELLREHSNIKMLIASLCFEDNIRVPCVDICIADNNQQGLPSFLSYKNAEGLRGQVKTRIIPNFNNAKPTVGRGEFVSNIHSSTFMGTVCCIVNSSSDEIFALTCNHVLTGGDFADPGNLGDTVVEFSFGNFRTIGNWQQGKMNNEVDAALISIDPLEIITSNDVNTVVYEITEDDCSKTEVELVGALSNTQRAFVIHENQSIPVDYNNQTLDMENLVSISTTLNHFNFTAPTQHADSGALVYHATTRQPIGMVVGANEQFSFIIPINSVLRAFDDVTLTIA